MEVNLNRRQKVLLVIGLIVLFVLLFQRFTSKTDELRRKCEAFVRSDKIGCYVSEEKITDTSLGRELTEMAKEAGYVSAKEACGCVTHNITDL